MAARFVALGLLLTSLSPAWGQRPPTLPLTEPVQVDIIACRWTPGPNTVSYPAGLTQAQTQLRVEEALDWWRNELRATGRDLQYRTIQADAGLVSPVSRSDNSLEDACRASASAPNHADPVRASALQIIVTHPPHDLFGRAGFLLLDGGRATSTLTASTAMHEIGHGLSLLHAGAISANEESGAVSPGLVPAGLEARARHLADGIGATHQIVWQAPSGQLIAWQMRGAEFLADFDFGDPVDPSWTPLGIGRLDDDSPHDQVLWRRDTALSLWSVDSDQINSAGPVFRRDYAGVALPDESSARANPDTTFGAIGDFNGDGEDDVFWRVMDEPAGGPDPIWERSFINLSGWSFQSGAVARGYDLVAISRPDVRNGEVRSIVAGNFNGDQADDLVISLSDGSLWLAPFVQSGGLPILLDRRGQSNIGPRFTQPRRSVPQSVETLRLTPGNQSERATIELSNRVPTRVQTSRLPTLTMPSDAWTLIGSGDFNLDGTDDVLWRRGSELSYSPMNRGRLEASVTIAQAVPAGYRFVGVGNVVDLQRGDNRIIAPRRVENLPSEYGDFTALMGPNRPRLNAFAREKLGILSLDRVIQPTAQRSLVDGVVICDPDAGYALPEVIRVPLDDRQAGRQGANLPAYALIEYASVGQGRQPVITRVDWVRQVVNDSGRVIPTYRTASPQGQVRSAIYRSGRVSRLAPSDNEIVFPTATWQPGSSDLPLPRALDLEEGRYRVLVDEPTAGPVIDPATGRTVVDPDTGRTIADAAACAVVRVRPACEAGLVARSDATGDMACVSPQRRSQVQAENRQAAANAVSTAPGSACRPGFVWREMTPEDRVCVPQQSRTLAANESRMSGRRYASPIPSHAGYHTCAASYVWREADRFDVVCVSQAERRQIAEENRSNPVAQANGRCPNGLVLRETYAADRVCVIPQRRQSVRQDNAAAPSRLLYAVQ